MSFAAHNEKASFAQLLDRQGERGLIEGQGQTRSDWYATVLTAFDAAERDSYRPISTPRLSLTVATLDSTHRLPSALWSAPLRVDKIRPLI